MNAPIKVGTVCWLVGFTGQEALFNGCVVTVIGLERWMQPSNAAFGLYYPISRPAPAPVGMPDHANFVEERSHLMPFSDPDRTTLTTRDQERQST